MATHFSILAGKNPTERGISVDLVGHSPQGRKESDMTECPHTHTQLGKLTWELPAV